MYACKNEEEEEENNTGYFVRKRITLLFTLIENVLEISSNKYNIGIYQVKSLIVLFLSLNLHIIPHPARISQVKVDRT